MSTAHIVRQGDVYFTLKESLESHTQSDDDVNYLAELTKFSKYYARLLDPTTEPSNEISSRLFRLNRIEATTAYPFLLNAYDSLAGGRLSPADFTAILDILESFLIRRFVCGVPTNALSKIFVVLYSQAARSTSLIEGVRGVLKDREFPRDQLFRDRLITFRLYGTGDRLPRTRLILERLEQALAHKEPISFDSLNVEHIMPQTLTDAWKEDLGTNWEISHETLLHTIGNLTLTGYNPELSNASYLTKRAILQKSHVELNRYFSTEDKWNEQAILRRADYMADLALRTWPDFARGEREFEFEAPDEEEEQEDVQLLKAKVLDVFGGKSERVANTRYHIYKLPDGKVINIKYSRPQKDYYWFGVHASLWDGCLKAGVTHMIFILGQHGFVSVPLAILKDYLAEAGTSPKADGTVRHYHVLISREPMLELFHFGKPARVPLKHYLLSLQATPEQGNSP